MIEQEGESPLPSGSICAFHYAGPGSDPEHTSIYAFKNFIDAPICYSIVKRWRKLETTDAAAVGPN